MSIDQKSIQLLAKESKEAFENVRDDIDRQDVRLDDLGNEQAAESTTMKNKLTDVVMEIAMIRQAIQSKDLSLIRNSVIDGLQRTQTQFDISNGKPSQGVSNRLALLEARLADLQQALMTKTLHSQHSTQDSVTNSLFRRKNPVTGDQLFEFGG